MNKEEARMGLIAAIDNECVNHRCLAECLSTWRGHGRPPGLTLIEAQLEMSVNRTASAIDDFEAACREGIRAVPVTVDEARARLGSRIQDLLHEQGSAGQTPATSFAARADVNGAILDLIEASKDEVRAVISSMLLPLLVPGPRSDHDFT
jgi:hypothetical protein